MKAFVNPFILLIVMGLFAWGLTDRAEYGTDAGLWAVVVCATAFVVNGALCLSRGLTHRPALMSAVWTVVYLILSACGFILLNTPTDDIYAEDKAALSEQLKGWKEAGKSPFANEREEQECLIVLAAGLGKNHLLRQLLELPEAAKNADVLAKAAKAAAENKQKKALSLLLEAGVPVDAVSDGSSLLCTAVVNGNRDIVKFLLEKGANATLPDADGVSPIMHAVINDDLTSAGALMKHGANPAAKAKDGRDAFSCSRTAEMDEVLQSRPNTSQ